MTLRVGIVGAGTMGSGIMINAIVHGLNVTLCDQSLSVLSAAKEKLKNFLKRQIDKGRLDTSCLAHIEHLHLTTNMDDLNKSNIVIEAVFEDLELKHKIFDHLQEIVSQDCVLATNTSCLALSDIAKVVKEKSRLCGLHYFSPAEINPIVELITCDFTSEQTRKFASDFLERTARKIVQCNDSNGFALNRFFCPYCNEAARLVGENIATTAQIDQVATDKLGVALGPFAVMNIVKPSVMFKAQQNLETFGPLYRTADNLKILGEKNDSWTIDAHVEPVSADISKLIEERLVGALLVPFAELVAEGVAKPDEVDFAAQHAFKMATPPSLMFMNYGPGIKPILEKICKKYSHTLPKLPFDTVSASS